MKRGVFPVIIASAGGELLRVWSKGLVLYTEGRKKGSIHLRLAGKGDRTYSTRKKKRESEGVFKSHHRGNQRVRREPNSKKKRGVKKNQLQRDHLTGLILRASGEHKMLTHQRAAQEGEVYPFP